ncbi:MAG: hypothetical protein NVV66_16315 [Cellulomonas sp.]|uniref:hypothetical protein n=1 Tax=Cellulomonas sp. TaxID=40001 RepID=UPI0025852C1B|nr:hypothetical protein [Cellulomonas sp.]MCR6706181.1 hypothetical protein [Cellulomonas sp.]
MMIESLAGQDVTGDRIATEVLYAEACRVRGSTLSWTVPTSSSLKMPHGSRVSGTPLTQHLGSLLADFQRVAIIPAPTRWAVQVLPGSIEAHLARRTALRWPLRIGDELVVTPTLIAALPATARGKVLSTGVEARSVCTHEVAVGAGFTFRAYKVD